jgi:hypothetical protein
MGLFVGISFLSFVEIAEFAFNISWVFIKRQKPNDLI